tara:strand:+ start:19 stop:384 length:366 start_codon:yes stop_codon:yes gene_type:complete
MNKNNSINVIILVGLSLMVLYYFFGTEKENFSRELKENTPTLKTRLNLVDKDPTRKTQYVKLYGRPNKCFSCEKEVLKTAGQKYIHYAFPSKCFSCEKQSKNPYMEGPTKCFACDQDKNIY